MLSLQEPDLPSPIGGNVSGARSDNDLRLALLAGLNKSVRRQCGLTCQYIWRVTEITMGRWSLPRA